MLWYKNLTPIFLGVVGYLKWSFNALRRPMSSQKVIKVHWLVPLGSQRPATEAFLFQNQRKNKERGREGGRGGEGGKRALLRGAAGLESATNAGRPVV